MAGSPISRKIFLDNPRAPNLKYLEAARVGDLGSPALRVVRLATGEDPAMPEDAERHAKHVETGRAGGLKGGKARADALSAEQRSASARKAAKARWEKV